MGSPHSPRPRPLLLGKCLGRLTASLLLLGLTLAAQVEAQELRPPAALWLAENAQEITSLQPGTSAADLQFFGPLLGQARVLGIGEGIPGDRQSSRFKRRLFEYLVQEEGFRIFAVAADFAECERIDSYIQGGAGDPQQMLAALRESSWHGETLLGLIRWMRSYNQSQEKKLSFIGFDLQHPETAMEDVVTFLRPLSPSLSKSVERAYEGLREIPALGVSPMAGVSLGGELRKPPKAGRKLTFSGWRTTRDLDRGWAGLWLRVDGDQPAYADTAAEESTEESWQQLTLSLTIPPGARRVTFGVTHRGNGTAWFDGLRVELGGREVKTKLDLDFEREESPRLVKAPLLLPDLQARDYKVQIDDTGHFSGKRCLRITYDPRLDQAAARTRSVVGTLARARFQLEQRANRSDVDRLLRKAKAVQQAFSWRARQEYRGAIMAENLVAALEGENTETRVMVSASNTQLGRNSEGMGKSLADSLGKAYFNLATMTASDEGAKRPLRSRAIAISPQQVLARYGPSANFVLDLRLVREEDAGSGWLLQPLLVRGVSALAEERQYSPLALPKFFDGLIFLRETVAPL